MKVIRIEYMLNEMNWKCNVLAKDAGDGVKFLEQHLKAPFRVISTEEVCEIHAISTFVRGLLENKKEPPKKVVKEEKENTIEKVEKKKPGRPPKK